MAIARILIWGSSAIALSAPFCVGVALAQRVDENAVAQASDAFGIAVGSEKTGLYSSDDIRGFNPVDAGNARIEGLYFDQLDRITQRLLDGNTIHVGISAQHYPFPAPTGIVDYALTVPGEKFSGSLDVETGEYGGPRFALDMKIPLAGSKLGLVAGIGARHQVQGHGGTARLSNFGALLAWQPYEGAQVLAFTGSIYTRSDEARASLFPAGDFLPPVVPRRTFLGQLWSGKDFDIHTSGMIAKMPMGEFRLEAALFQSRRVTMATFADLVTGVGTDGTSLGRTIIADGNNRDNSTSGEVRLQRAWQSNAFRHVLTASLRGRSKDRQFGGAQRIALGASSAVQTDFRPRPAITLGPENSDKVRQVTYGLSYDMTWAGRGSLNLGLAQSRYRKSVDFADPLAADVATRDSPLLWNVSASLVATPRLALYASFVKGQEEALIAPEIASNRSEAPPAIRTKQIEAGLRYAITPTLALVAGVFSIRKPYYNLDPALRYRQLGTLENRGIEVSLAGKLAPGLSLVAGSVFLDPRISGEAIDNGLIGRKPVGSLKRRTIVNLDWRSMAGNGPWSVDVGYDGRGSRAGNAANSLFAPARNTLHLGGRYRFDLFSTRALVRVAVTNLFNEYSWVVNSSGGFLYSDPRAASVQLIADF